MKNKRSMIIIIAMVLLLAVVLGMGGATFAKYVTTLTPVDTSAKVAKWGFELGAVTTNLFGEDYKYNSTAASSTKDGTGVLTVSAASSNANNVVAPGTSGSMTFNLNGSAEVLSKFVISAEATDIVLAAGTVVVGDNAGTPVMNEEYHPIKWKIEGTATTTAEGGSPVNIDNVLGADLTTEQLVANLNNLDANTAAIAPNTTFTINLTISWAWAFESNDATNIMDTYLGSQATPQEITLDITASITQLAQ